MLFDFRKLYLHDSEPALLWWALLRSKPPRKTRSCRVLYSDVITPRIYPVTVTGSCVLRILNLKAVCF